MNLQLTERQQDILSCFKCSQNIAIPHMKCEKDDMEILELEKAGIVKITPYEVDGKTFYEFSPIFESPFFS